MSRLDAGTSPHGNGGRARSWTRLVGLITFATASLLLSGAPRATERPEALELLLAGDIAEFDARATKMRESRARSTTGLWMLYRFYRGTYDVESQSPTAAFWPTLEAETAAYLRKHPDSPSAVDAAARVLVSHAWASRGTGWAAELSDAQSAGFADYLERARRVLDEHRDVGVRDPDWYSQRLHVMNGQGDDRREVLALAKEALAHEPTYQGTYFVAANALLPKWGGSRELVQEYVSAVLERTKAQEGTQAYARIMAQLARSDRDPIGVLRLVGADWSKLKVGLAEISRMYPDPWNLNEERAFACLYGTKTDYEESAARIGHQYIAAEWFDTLHDWPSCLRRQQEASGGLGSWHLEDLAQGGASPFALSFASVGVLLSVTILQLYRRKRLARIGRSGQGVSAALSPEARIYRLSRAWQALQGLAGALLFVAGVAGFWYFGIASLGPNNALVGLLATLGCGYLASGGAQMIQDSFTQRLVLDGEVLHWDNLWGPRECRRGEIATKQTLHRRNNPAQLLLRDKDPARRPLKIPLIFDLDTQFDAWLLSIPDADALAASALRTEVSSDPTFGTTPEERLETLARATKVAKRLAVAAPILYFWSVLYPQPYTLIVALLLAGPWLCVALMVHQRGVYQVSGGRSRAGRPDLAVVLFAFAGIMTLRAWTDLRIVNWWELAPWATLFAVILAAAIVSLNGTATRSWSAVLVILIAACGYGFGTAGFADTLLDNSAPSVFRTKVLNKHVSSGRYRVFDLYVERWGADPGTQDLKVTPGFYGQVTIGDTVCIALRKGALGAQWYSVEPCSAG
jgi:hypothetical protein